MSAPDADRSAACSFCGGPTHFHDSSFCDREGCRACSNKECGATECGHLPRNACSAADERLEKLARELFSESNSIPHISCFDDVTDSSQESWRRLASVVLARERAAVAAAVDAAVAAERERLTKLWVIYGGRMEFIDAMNGTIPSPGADAEPAPGETP